MKRIKVASIVLIVIILFGGYYGYKKYNNSKQQNLNKTTNNKTINNKTNSNEKLKKTVTDAVSKAENNKTQADIDEARKLVDILPAGADKDSLNKKLDSISASDKSKTNTVLWVKNPEYNGIKTLISGTVDIKKVKSVKAFVDGKEVEVKLDNNGLFSINCDKIEVGKTVKVKAYDENNKEVNSKDVLRSL